MQPEHDMAGGVAPKSAKTAKVDLKPVDESELAVRRAAAKQIIEVGTPYLEWLTSLANDRDYVACILDADAVILLSLGARGLQNGFGLLPGNDWSEQIAGVNAASAALATDQPSAVVGREHSHPLLCELAGSAAPLHLRGRTAGVVDLITRVADTNPDQLTLITRVGLDIDRELEQKERMNHLAQLEACVAECAQTEHMLRQSEERFRLLVESWAQSVWETNIYGEAVTDSPSWRAYTGQTLEEYLGFGWLSAIHPDDRDRVERDWRHAVQSGTPLNTQLRLRHHSGEWRWANKFSAPLRGPEGSIQKWVGMNIDITAQRQAEEALQHADRRKNEFLATLAHELRNPLAPIRHATKIAEARNATEPQRQWAHEVIDRQISHMARLLDDLLEASRISRGKLELRMQNTTLQSALETAIETARPMMELKHHVLSLDVPDEPIWVEADPVRLAQIFTNLLTNAAKYTDPRGRITLQVVPERTSAAICVRDTGIGISPEMLPRIFHMFSQARDALDRAEGGLGIGLALVHGLVELHGGIIEAKSPGLGRGSEFIVRLPIQPQSRQVAWLPQPSTPVKLHRHRVLVADDNRDSADCLAMMLRLGGHEVEVSGDGWQATISAAIFHPDIALIDIGMPELNGYEVARRIRAEPWGREMTLVAVTGWGQEEDKRRAFEAGFDQHLTKPVDPDAIERLLLEIATGKSGRRV
jgi:PAS domain S-box-containing protein